MENGSPIDAEMGALIRDLDTKCSQDAVAAAQRVAGLAFDVCPGAAPSLLLNAGWRLMQLAASVAASLEARDAAVLNDKHHPEAVRLFRAYGAAVEHYPDVAAMMDAVAAASGAGPRQMQVERVSK